MASLPSSTMINKKEECRRVIGPCRVIEKRGLKTPSLLQKNNMKKAKHSVIVHKKQLVEPSDDLVRKMIRNVQLLEGSLPEHFFSKIVTDSDTKQHHNRMLLPAKTKTLKDKLKMTLIYMGVELKMDVEEDMELPVMVVDGCRNTYSMKLRYLKSNGSYRIIGKEYTKFVQANELRTHVDTVHVWVFHVGHGAERVYWLGLMKEEQPVKAIAMPPADNIKVKMTPEEKIHLSSLIMLDYRAAEEIIKEREKAAGESSLSWLDFPFFKRYTYVSSYTN